jgi:hypothetical protein
MWWWLRRICGGGGAGYVVGQIKNKANSAPLELELGLSLGKVTFALLVTRMDIIM